MFTGLVEMFATMTDVHREPPGVRLVFLAHDLADDIKAGYVKVGDSFALNGCCLTLVAINADRISFEAGEETLKRTNLGQLQPGGMVNVERSMRLGDRLDGHLVTGHIDGVGTLDSRKDAGGWSTYWFRAPQELMPQIASKGSIAIDGVSLTLVDVEKDRFSVMLIPHTLTNTTLAHLKPGDKVNLETDILAKYVQRQLKAKSRKQKAE